LKPWSLGLWLEDRRNWNVALERERASSERISSFSNLLSEARPLIDGDNYPFEFLTCGLLPEIPSSKAFDCNLSMVEHSFSQLLT
jgi:hypothetical protein